MKYQYYGYNLPFLGGSQNILSMQVDERLIKNDLIQLLLTSPGERVMRPDFGTMLRGFLFENIDDPGALSTLRENIITQITKYEQRVTINDITITGNSATHKITVVVNVSPINQPLTEYLIEVNSVNQ